MLLDRGRQPISDDPSDLVHRIMAILWPAKKGVKTCAPNLDQAVQSHGLNNSVIDSIT
jgi:hypothetical protein